MSQPVLRPLTLGEILDVAFGLYRGLFVPLLVVTLATSAIPLALSVYIEASGGALLNLPLYFGNLLLNVVLGAIASAAATFSIGPGKNDFGSQRNLNNPLIVGPTGNIAYRLFHNAGRTMEYLPDVKIPISQPILAGVPFELTIYGRVEGGQNLLAGGYTDQATGTLAL